MYPSYSRNSSLSRRSQSTLDISQSSRLEPKPFTSPNLSFLSRKAHRNRSAPTPPRRSDSIGALDAEALKRSTRSYLTDDVRRQFELGFVNSSSTDKSDDSPSRTTNFVKRLVATLERRQKEVQSVSLEPRKTTARGPLRATEHRRSEIFKQPVKHVVLERFKSEPLISRRRPPSQLEDLTEAENEDTTADEYQSDDTDSDEFWGSDVSSAPTSLSRDESSVEDLTAPVASRSIIPDKAKVRRSLKNMFSALMSWKLGKQLPRGSRDYYATRESLGEEMRAFRRDTMPKLMKRAGIKTGPPHRQQQEQQLQQQEFNDLIGSPKLVPEASIATIHPVYGCKAQLMPLRLSRPPEAKLEESEVATVEEKKLEVPAGPVERLVRPSAVADLQKRLSRELDATVQLRRQPSPVVYDVPRNNRPVSLEQPPAEERTQLVELHHGRTSAPLYENLSAAIAEDKRQCTTFTTF